MHQSDIVTSTAFRDICASNSCGYYGKCWMCPPDVGQIGPMMEQLRSYPLGILYQTIGQLEDSFDIEGMGAAGDHHVQVSQRIQRAVKPLLGERMLHLTCGGCHLCPTCAKRDDQPCRHPELALPSLESYGVDVYQTTRATSLRYINGPDTVTYFGMVLFSEEWYAITDHPSRRRHRTRPLFRHARAGRGAADAVGQQASM